MKIKRGANAVIYARYSPGPRQTDRSIEGQLEDDYAFAKKYDLNIVHVYIDRRISGTDFEHRDDFNRMIADAAKQQFEYIIVWKTDRFGRNRYEIAVNKHAVMLFGVTVLPATEEIPEGAAGIIMEGLLETLSEYYLAELKEKLRRGMLTAARNGCIPGGSAPYAFMTVEKRYIVVEDEAAILNTIFQLMDTGMTAPRVSSLLAERGIYNRDNKPFSPGHIYKLVRNRKYIGEYEYEGIPIPIPAIVDKDLFERVNARLATHAHKPATYKAAERYLLSCKCFCSNCGAMMVGESGYGKHKKMYSYYKCATNKKRKGISCPTKTFRKADLEELVCKHTQDTVLIDPVINVIADEAMKIQAADTVNHELNLLKKQLSEVQSAKRNILKAIEAGVFTTSTRDRLLELESQETTLNTSIASHEIEKPALTKDQIRFWLYAFKTGDIHSEDFRQELASTFINSVYVDEKKVVIVYNYCDDSHSTALRPDVGSDTFAEMKHGGFEPPTT